jgi:membrane protease subunit HflK
METVLEDMDKVLVEEGKGGSGVVPYLPLNELRSKRQASDSAGDPGDQK